MTLGRATLVAAHLWLVGRCDPLADTRFLKVRFGLVVRLSTDRGLVPFSEARERMLGPLPVRPFPATGRAEGFTHSSPLR